MKLIDFKKGDIVDIADGYIIEVSGNIKDGRTMRGCPYVCGNRYENDGSFYVTYETKEASYEEKCHLLRCIRAGEFVPRDEAEVPLYEIY